MTKRLIGGACVAAILATVACNGASDRLGPDVDAIASQPATGAASVPRPFDLSAAQERGRGVYETMCWTCHGMAGRGDGPAVRSGSVSAPPDFTTGEYPGLTGERLRMRFRPAGDPREPIHPHMDQVVAFLTPDVFLEALEYVPLLGWPAELPASALAGREIYAARCVACHGPEGRGEGSAARYVEFVAPPANFTEHSLIVQGDYQRLFERIKAGGGPVYGSAMPPWGVSLSDEQIRDVVAFIATLRPGAFAPPPGAVESR
jgi:mono/diheme cytochrome c family protein